MEVRLGVNTRRISYIVYFILVATGAWFFLHGFSDAPRELAGTVSGKSFAMGAECRVVIYVPKGGELEAEPALREAFAAIEDVDAACSLYNENSDICRVNNGAAIDKIRVGNVFSECLKSAFEAGKISNGIFNPAIRPVLKLWGFGPHTGEKRVPAATELSNALALSDSALVEFDSALKAVHFKKQGVALDFNGIAQGFATERAAEKLCKLGITSALVESGGGEFALIGRKRGTEPFRIGIHKPSKGASRKDAIAVFLAYDVSFATSGDYEKFFTANGRRYSHLIDPRTGAPKDGPQCSVTVIGESCTLCDALATACAILPAIEALDLIARVPGYEVIIAQQAADVPMWFYSSGIGRDGDVFYLLRQLKEGE